MEKTTVTVRGPKEKKNISDLLGKFSQKSFYMDLIESIIREMFRAAALAFAAAVTSTITRQITSDRVNAPQSFVPPQSPAFNDSDLSRRAYGTDSRYGGYGNQQQSFPPSPPVNTNFPGFGGR